MSKPRHEKTMERAAWVFLVLFFAGILWIIFFKEYSDDLHGDGHHSHEVHEQHSH